MKSFGLVILLVSSCLPTRVSAPAYRQTINKAAQATVLVMLERDLWIEGARIRGWRLSGWGSGAVLYSGKYSLVQTADHVVGSCIQRTYSNMVSNCRFVLEFRDTKNRVLKRVYRARVAERHKKYDVALLRVEMSLGASLRIAKDVSLGDRVHVWGYPGIMSRSPELSFESGVVASFVPSYNAHKNIPHFTRFRVWQPRGSSGSAIVNMYGEVVGIVCCGRSPMDTYGANAYGLREAYGKSKYRALLLR